MDEHNMDVIAVVGEVGQEHEGLEAVRQKALRTGAIEAYVVDMREELVDEYLTDAIRANALYENKYPLLSAMSRPVISRMAKAYCRSLYHAAERFIKLSRSFIDSFLSECTISPSSFHGAYDASFLPPAYPKRAFSLQFHPDPLREP